MVYDQLLFVRPNTSACFDYYLNSFTVGADWWDEGGVGEPAAGISLSFCECSILGLLLSIVSAALRCVFCSPHF